MYSVCKPGPKHTFSGQEMEYTPWYPGEPNNNEQREYFVSIMYKKGKWGINDAKHDFGLSYVCEYEKRE